MEEVDKILITNLKNLGCSIDDDITNLKEFPVDLIFEALSLCLSTIDPTLTFPKSISSMPMSARINAAMSAAKAIENLGYRNDIGYQTVLYCNEVDIRRVFMFLVERLPRDCEKDLAPKSKSRLDGILDNVGAVVRSEFERKSPKNASFRPFRSRPLSSPIVFKGSDAQGNSYWSKYIPTVPEQCSSLSQLHWSVIVDNDKRLAEQTHANQSLAHILDNDKPLSNSKQTCMIEQEEPINARTHPKETDSFDIKLKDVHDEIEQIHEQIRQVENNIATLQHEETRLLERQQTEEHEVACLAKEWKSKNRARKLLGGDDDNIENLSELAAVTRGKIATIHKKWAIRRAELLDELQVARERRDERVRDSKQGTWKRQITAIQTEIASLSEEYAGKSELLTKLKRECRKLPDDINRGFYTQRILDIIENIHKQNKEIYKILDDTRNVQKEINVISGKLDRSFLLTDETIYADARQDECARKAYKLLASLHQDCNGVVEMTSQIGNVDRDIRELNDQIDNERAKETHVKLEKILADLRTVQKEISNVEIMLGGGS